MKKSNFAESQVIGYLRRMEQGQKTADLCREAGVSQGAMYQWKSKYYGMEVSQLKKLKEMESELSQYKKIAAELTLQNSVLKDVIEKKAIGPAEKQEPVDYSREAHGISLRQACILFSLHFSVYYYKPKPNEDHLVRDALSSFGEGYQNSFLYCLENQ